MIGRALVVLVNIDELCGSGFPVTRVRSLAFVTGAAAAAFVYLSGFHQKPGF